jgi:peptide chain release factor 2
MEVRRLETLREELDLVRELVEASFAEGNDAVASDLGQSYARLLRKLARAERELVSFSERDQGDAIVTVRPAGSRDGASGWARDLSDMYFAWGKERGYDVDVDESTDGICRVRVRGAYALGYLKSEEGSHRLILPPEGKGERRGDTFLARVDVTAITADAADGSRSTNGKEEPPIRTYDLWRSRGVRDRRTGHVDGDVRRVLGGRIDGFLEAFLELQHVPSSGIGVSGSEPLE